MVYLIKKIKEYLGYITKKEPWQIAAGRYFVENSEIGFKFDQYKKFIKSKYNVGDIHISQFWEEVIQSPTGRQFPRNGDHIEGTWTPTIELVSIIVDYDELIEARKNARQAFGFSIIAIIISALSLIKNLFLTLCI